MGGGWDFFLEIDPSALAMGIECSPLKLEKAVLDPAINSRSQCTSEFAEEDEESKDGHVEERDYGTKGNNKC